MHYIASYTLAVLSRRKRRFFLTALAIALGISLVVQTQILNDTFERNYLEVAVESIGNTDILVYSLTDTYFEQDVYDKLFEGLASEFQGIFPQISLFTTVFYEAKGQFEQNVLLQTIGPDFNAAYWGSVVSQQTGETLDITSLEASEACITPALADSLGVNIGDSISINLIKDDGTPLTPLVTIKEIVDYKGYGKVGLRDDFRRLFMSHKAVQSLIQVNLPSPMTQIVFGINNHENEVFLGWERTNQAKAQIEHLLEQQFPDESFIVFPQRQVMRDAYKEGITDFTNLLGMFGVVVIVSGLLLITNIQLMSMEDRQQQIGMLRAIGAKKREILLSYALETLLVAIVAGFLGLSVGMVIAIWLNNVSRSMLSSYGGLNSQRSFFDVVVNPGTLITSIVSALVVALVTGIVPALQARGTSVISILRKTSKSSHLLQNGKRPLWPLVLGIICGIIGLTFLISQIASGHPFYSVEGYHNIEKEYIDNFLGFIAFSIGIIFVSFRYEERTRLGVTIGGILLLFITFLGFQFAIDWVEEGSDFNRAALIGVLCGVGGATAVVSANLELFTSWLRQLLSLSKLTRATGLVATRFINSRKPRAILTFAIFAVVLSLNFMVGGMAHSQRHGSAALWEDTFTKIPIVVESQRPFDLAALDYPTLLQNRFANEIENIFALSTSRIIAYKGESARLSPDQDSLYAKMIAINFQEFQDEKGHARYPFLLDDLVPPFSRLSMIERMKDRTAQREESSTFWNSFLAGDKLHRQTLQIVEPDDPNGLSMIACERMDWWGLRVGDIISLPAKNGSYIEVICAASFSYFPSFNLPSYSGSGLVINGELANQIDILEARSGFTEFLVETKPHVGFHYDRNELLCAQIEEFSNTAGEDTLLALTNGSMLGITSHNLWDLIAYRLDNNTRFLDFLQFFISMGLVIGVLGLLIVSRRSVTERKREIGLLRSVGFSRPAVSLAILLELLFLGFLGFFVGLAVGNYTAWAAADIQNITFVVPWTQVLTYGLIIIGSVFAAAIVPAWAASRIPPSEALQYRG
jgi:putative ABC transport system permease protein